MLIRSTAQKGDGLLHGFVFPGQGAQEVGMGADLYDQCPAAREIFDRADAVMAGSGADFKVTELCFSGPAEKLNATDVQQPAIFTTSAAALAALRSSEKYADRAPAYAAGLSLGEYTAYYASGSLDFDSALKLVAARASYMQEAAEACDSAMVAVIGLDDDQAKAVCDQAGQGEVLVTANFNCPGQIVLSGTRPACERAVQAAEQAGAMKVVLLDVAGAFHSPLMQPAADRLRKMLEATEFKSPTIPVVANVDCEIHEDPSDIRENLYRQVTCPTYWARSMQKLLDLGVDEFVEIGPKKTLTAFMRRISRRTKTANISGMGDVS